jgi:hypothetical protein
MADTTTPTPTTPTPGALDPATLFLTLGTTGLQHSGGILQEELDRELAGPQGLRRLRDMRENSAITGAILFAIEMLIRNVTYRIAPANDTQDARKWADWLDGALFKDLGQTWHAALSEILSMLWAGWSYHEICYKRRQGDTPPPGVDRATWAPSKYADGLIGWNGWPVRAQETLLNWEFGPNGQVLAMVQMDPYAGRTIPPIPMEKALLFRPTATKGNPQGRSLLRTGYPSYYYSKHLSKVEGIVVERGLGDLPVMYIPPNLMSVNASPEERAMLAECQKIVTNIRQDEQAGVLLPAIYNEGGQLLYKLELLTASGSHQYDMNAIIRRYDLNIALSVIADVLFIGHEQAGAYALAESKSQFFGLGIQSYVQSIVSEINECAIPRLWKLNGLRPELMPALAHGEIQTIDLKEIGQYIKDLSGAGFDLLDLENHLRTIGGMPERTAPALPAAATDAGTEDL